MEMVEWEWTRRGKIQELRTLNQRFACFCGVFAAPESSPSTELSAAFSISKTCIMCPKRTCIAEEAKRSN